MVRESFSAVGRHPRTAMPTVGVGFRLVGNVEFRLRAGIPLLPPTMLQSKEKETLHEEL